MRREGDDLYVGFELISYEAKIRLCERPDYVSYELVEIEMLPTPSAAKHLRGFLFDRDGNRVVACRHAAGEGTLCWTLGPKEPLGALRYFETDKTRAEVKSAWSAATLADKAKSL